MKYLENIQQVAELEPDYLGFIFYEASKRNFDGVIPELPKSIKKVGVFVNADIEFVVDKIKKHDLQSVQLHGDESVEYIHELHCQFEPACSADRRSRERLIDNKDKHPLDSARGDNSLEIIKVFGIKEEFNFEVLKPYEDAVDYFLFDTKGEERGGNGIAFDWKVLEKYNSNKPFFLSGGIGLENTSNVLSFLRKQESKYCYALDVNSKFESKPGVKKIEELQEFKKNVITSKAK